MNFIRITHKLNTKLFRLVCQLISHINVLSLWLLDMFQHNLVLNHRASYKRPRSLILIALGKNQNFQFQILKKNESSEEN